MIPPAPKASGRPRLARFVSLVFLILACIALPQQAAAQTSDATVSIANASVAENVTSGNAEFTVSLTQAVTEDVTLAVAYATGATNGATLATDLGALSDTVTITANTTSATLLVPITDDDIVEGDETFTVTISEGTTPLPVGVTIGTGDTATGTITDDDVPTVNLRAVRDVTEGAAQLRFRIDLNTRLTGDITLSWRVSGGTASAADFDDRYADTGTATIERGRRTVPIDFAPIIDGVTEGDETLELTISNPPSGVQIGTATATGTISNSDAAAVNIGDKSVAENGGSVDFTVSLSRAVNSNVVLDVIYEGTGDNPVELARDLGGRPPTVTIDQGQTEATITVPVNNDALVEGDETFVVRLRERPANPLPDDVIIDDGSAIGTIVDNETGQVTLGPPTLTAAEDGTFTYTVSLSRAAEDAVTVRWTATDGSATVDDDLRETTGTVTFPVRSNSAQTFDIAVNDDDLDEDNETFTVTLGADDDNPLPTGITIGTTNSSTAAITDNDDTPATVAPQITTQPTDQSVTVGENATFTVAATGTPTPTYQWRFEGSDISGATSASYTLSNAALTNAGDYTVVVTNTAGTVTSSAATLTVTAATVAPQITTQPTDQSVTVGENATFTVAATGTPTPTYQWRFEGSDISGATSASYTLSNAALTNAGDYTVVVTNTAGEVTSSAATLTVTAATVAPQITTQPTDQSVTVGENATFTVAATGTPTPTYQWRFEGSDISGATSASYTLSNAALTNAGDYTVVVTNTAGEVTSTAATLTVTAAAPSGPDLTVDGVTVSSASVVEGASFTINATVNNEGNAASAATTLTYYRSADATITTDDTSIATDAVGALAASGSSTQDASVSIATAGTYYVGACVPTVSGETDTDNNCSTGVEVVVTAAAVAPQITTQPTDQSVTVGENATFTVTATGTPTPTYQWRFEGSDISGATSASYTLSNAALTNAGDYTVVVTNTAGTVTSSAATLTVTAATVAPQITTQPTDQSVTVGENATFTVTATGTPTPTYQWRFEGSDISGATSASYTLSNAALTNAGDYTVVVTNTAGTVTSSAATLTVTAATVAPQITTQPTDQSVTVGENATFTVTATGTPTPTYQWRFEGSDISGATSASYTLSNAALTNAGDYTVVVTNTAGEVTSTAATLTVTAAAPSGPDLTVDGVTVSSASVVEGASFTINATVNNEGNAASAATTLTYYRSADATITTDDTSIATDAVGALAASGSSTQDASVSIATAGTYYVGACVPTVSGETDTDNNCSTGVEVVVTAAAVAPQITTQPTDQSVTVGENATFTVTATGTPTPTYQWRFEGSDISGATSASYTLSSAALTNAGDYTVVVTNTAGTVTSSAATLTVTAATVAPQITTQPTDQSVTVGENATFTVTATGTPTPTYQWRFEGSDISGATSASYTLSNAALTNAGDYTVVVTNTAGTVTSSAATLTVTAATVAPQITTQPTDQSVTVGENATFTVAATGTPTPTYQWRFEGSDISGATSASYTLSNAALTNAGDYTVVVTNTAGEVTSSAATLTVTAATVAPQITTQPTDQSITVGENATFTVAATGTPTPTYQWRFEGSDISGATSASYTLSNAALTNAGDYTVVVTNTAGTVTSSAATLTVTAATVAPQITTQPTDQSVTVGENATFTVAATGTPTPTYQWRFEGSDISGATSETYTVSNAALTNAGDYTVVVTNTAGTVTSSAATLTVTAAAPSGPDLTVDGVTVSSASVVEGASFTINATVNNEGNAASAATTLTYYRSADATITTDDTSIATDAVGALAASGSSTQDASVSIATAGTYYVGACVPTVSGETDTDNNCSTGVEVVVTAAAVAPQITTQPTDQSVTVGENATFTVTATGTPTPTYQWRFEGSDISGATSASYTLSNAALTNAGDYTVVVTNTAGTVTSSAATLTVTAATVAPQITTQPTDQSVTVGENATFTVAATGTPTPTYQWRFEGSDISGATSASYTLSNAALTNAGDYTVVVTNTAGEVTSSAATLTVTAATVAPQITTQPTDQSITVGENATFTVAATGTPTPTYQWRFEGSDISGATSASYTLSNAALTNAGDYTVVVTNTAGTVTSSAATLTVTAATVAPQITTQPTDQSVTVGENATFTVAATGTPTPTYQWRFEGSDISGATSETYTVSNAALTNAGDYTVVVTNTAGTVTSSAATLTVTAAAPSGPDLTVDGVTVSSASVVEGASFTINATVNNEGNAASAATTLTYYRSADATITADDTSIATDAVGALAASGSSTQDASVSIATAGTYYVGACVPTVSGETDTDNNCSTGVEVVVTAAAVAPQITTQPTDQSVTVGENATFTVTATGTPTPTYQWRFEGSDISGATSASYTLSNAALTNAGDYTVVVTNTAGTVTSSAATLTVTAAVTATVNIADADPVAEGAGPARFMVSLSRAADSDVVLDIAYAASTASLADLGNPRPATVTIKTGATKAAFHVPIFDDDMVEGTETFTVTLTVNTAPDGVTVADGVATGTIAATAEPSVLIEPRRIGAGTALRRHAGRFDTMTGTVVRSRLRGSIMKTLTLSENIGSGAAAAGGRLGKTRWGSWIDGSYAGFGGKATGRQADVYGGFDFLGGNGKWLIGALAGHEVADLRIGKATYSTHYTHLGLYGGVRLSDRLVFDGALTYGMATPEVALGDVSASYDANRITARIALTGDFGLAYGLGTGSVRVEPQIGLLYSREALGAFTDSAGGVAKGETLELGRFSFGPRLTWDFDWGQVVGGARVQWDFLQIDDGVDGRLSGAADIGLRFGLAPGVTLGVHGDVDGIGITDGFGSLGGRVQLDARF